MAPIAFDPALPINQARRLPVVSVTHGTEVYRGDAPSVQPSGFEPAPAYTYASAGFATAAPRPMFTTTFCSRGTIIGFL